MRALGLQHLQRILHGLHGQSLKCHRINNDVISHLAELVGGTESALLFEPGNAEHLADCIERVLTDQELADGLVDSGRELLEATYSWQAIAARTLNVYADAISAAG